MKRYQIENVVPTIFSIISIILIFSKFSLKTSFVIGTLLTLIGITIWWFGKITLHDAFTAMPKANKLIKKGIYSKFRHPIYVGLSLLLIGWMLIFNHWIAYIICSITIIVQIIRAHFEEKILEEKFGKEYTKYKKETLF